MSRHKLEYRDFVDAIDLDAFEDAIEFEPLEHRNGEDVGYCPDLWGLHKHGDASGKFAINREKRVYHCVPGDTTIATREGPRYAKDLAGQIVYTLSEGGSFRPAFWMELGEQEIYNIHLENGDIIQATLDHRWKVARQKGDPWTKDRRIWVTTHDLVGRRIPLQESVEHVYDEEQYRAGVIHGLVYGDGTKQSNTNKTIINGWGQEDRALIREFAPAYSEYESNGVPFTQGRKCPPYGKNLPSRDQSASYLRGFIAGLMAADGHIPANASPVLHQANITALYYLRRICGGLGIPVSSIRLDRKKNPWTDEDAPLYKMTFARSAFIADEKLILKPSHRVNAATWNHKRQNRHTVRVEQVCQAGRTTVYCCVEPETHTMVIDSGYLTGQCFVCGGGTLLSLAMEFCHCDEETATEWLYQFAHGDVRTDSEFIDDFMKLLDTYQEKKGDRMPYFNEHVLSQFNPEYHPLDPDGVPISWYEERGISQEVQQEHRLCYGVHHKKVAPIRGGEKIDDDYFGPCIVFPHFWEGRLVGWQHRWLNHGNDTPKWLPKYTNTSDFPKTQTLYNYDRALKQPEDRVVVVESVPTVLFLASMGVTAVATFGSGIVESQLRQLRRFSGGVIIAPDNDAPGEKFAKGASTYLERYVEVTVLDPVDLGEGADLGDYMGTSDPVGNLYDHLEQGIRDDVLGPI